MDDWYILVLWRLEIWSKFVWYDSCRVVNDSYSENRYRALRLCPIDFSLIPKVLVPPPEPKNMQSLQIWGICFGLDALCILANNAYHILPSHVPEGQRGDARTNRHRPICWVH